MKVTKKYFSVLTFILAIVAISFTCNITTYAAPAKSSRVTNVKKSNHAYDKYFKKAKLNNPSPMGTGTKSQMKLSNITLSKKKYKVKWSTSNAKVATVNSKGQIYAKSVGKAKIKASVTCNNKAVYNYTKEVRVTDPHFTVQNIMTYVGDTIRIKVDGASRDNYTLHIYDKNIIKGLCSNNQRVKASKPGRCPVWTWVDGKRISCAVYVNARPIGNPHLSSEDYFVTKGASEQITINEYAGRVAYGSSNSNVATVGSDGRIYGHNEGSCTVTVYLEDRWLTCYVAVGNETVTNTLKSAYGCLGCPYSQGRRMSNGYYDCSSFVWRNYSKYGVDFGTRNYAPTAAGEGENMVRQKKQISYKYEDPSRLLPGDVIFAKNSSNNGRYRNIGHVAIYMGNGRIIHATTPKVTIGKYSSYSKRIAVIARPTK